MTKTGDGHTLKAFDEDLKDLHALVMEMGYLVEGQIQRAIRALDDEDPALAREVIARDKLVNDLDVKIDEELVQVIARRQPMAGDLRNIMTMNKTVTDLERVGDEARKLAALVENFYGTSNTASPNANLVRDVRDMAEYGLEMLATVLVAFDEMNLQKAVEVINRDARIEEKFRGSLRSLSTYVMEDSRTVGYMVDAVLCLRALERIGGHAKNIAGYVIYFTTGRDVRHVDLETIVQEVLPEA
jgi:phosphate transport system protein